MRGRYSSNVGVFADCCLDVAPDDLRRIVVVMVVEIG